MANNLVEIHKQVGVQHPVDFFLPRRFRRGAGYRPSAPSLVRQGGLDAYIDQQVGLDAVITNGLIR
jgi:hypothetical protein